MFFSLPMRVALFTLCMTASLCGGAYAQDGFRAGDVVIKPSLDVTQEYDSNIYTEPSSTNGDLITRVAPQVIIEDATSPHFMQLKLGAEQTLYADDSDNNSLNYNAGAKGRYVFDDSLSFEASADYRHLHARRGDDEANPTSDAAEPIPFDVTRVSASVTKEIGAVTVTPRAGYTGYNFEDVRRTNTTLLDQDFRDRNEYKVGGRIGYALPQKTELYADAEFSPRDYRQGAALDRDSKGGDYLVGLRYRPSKALLADVALGYMHRDYDAIAHDDIDALDAAARLDWQFTDASKLSVKAGRSIVEVTDAGAGGAVRTDIGAGLTHNLSDVLTGTLEARYRTNDYEGGNGATNGIDDRKDTYYGASAGLSYAFSEQVALILDYVFGRNTSNRDSAEYDRNVIMAGVKVGF